MCRIWRYSIACLVLIFILPGRLQTQWIQAKGLQSGGSITDLAAYLNETGQTTIIAGTSSGGIYLSTNSGLYWSGKTVSRRYISAIAVSGDNIFTSSDYGVIRSTNNGNDWTNTGLTYGTLALAVKGDTIFAGTGSKGVLFSANNGDSWTAVSSGLTKNSNIIAFAVSGHDIYTVMDDKIFRLVGNDTSWTQVNKGLTDNIIRCIAVRPNPSGSNDIFAGTSNRGVILSTDNGESWNEIDSGLAIKDVRSLTVYGNHIFACGYNSAYNSVLFHSSNNGQSWTAVNTGLTNADVYTIAISRDFTDEYNIFAGTNNGVFCSTDYGSSWQSVSKDLIISYVTDFAVSPNGNVSASTCSDGIFLSINDGRDWSLVRSGAFGALAANEYGVFAANVSPSVDEAIFHSADYGKNWTAFEAELNNNDIRALALCGNVVAAGTYYNGIFWSTIRGLESFWGWVWGDKGSTNKCVNVFAVSGKNIYAGTNAGIFISADSAKTWTVLSSELDLSRNVLALAPMGNDLWAVIHNDIYLLSNGSYKMFTDFPQNTEFLSLAVSGNNVFAGTRGRGIYLSTNNGANWTQVNSGFPVYHNVHILAASDKYLLAGTEGGGIWIRPIGEMKALVTELSQTAGANDFSLEQNYPNPFNSSTAIKFSLPSASYVSLKVYNPVGREVSELLSQNMNAGNHTVVWNADNFASGVYYVKLTSDGFTDIKKLLLLK